MAEIIREIGAIARALDSISNIEFKEVALTRGQYLYLVRICENPGIIQEKIAEMLKVDRTTTARALKKLESNGLIRRVTDEQNKKNKRCYPTAQGEALYPMIIREHHHSTKVALAGLSEEDIQQLERLLTHVRKNISEDWNFVKKGNKRLY